MKFDAPFWLLVFSYWLHLLATVVWLGGLALMALVAWPAVGRKVLAAEQWAVLQQRFTPWANGSLVVLLITGFLQMTADTNYSGFLQVDSLWAQAILIKHIAVGGMILIGGYVQWRIHPAMARLALLAEKRPELAAAERTTLNRQEIRLINLNLVCATAVLLCTAVATAI